MLNSIIFLFLIVEIYINVSSPGRLRVFWTRNGLLEIWYSAILKLCVFFSFEHLGSFQIGRFAAANETNCRICLVYLAAVCSWFYSVCLSLEYSCCCSFVKVFLIALRNSGLGCFNSDIEKLYILLKLSCWARTQVPSQKLETTYLK